MTGFMLHLHLKLLRTAKSLTPGITAAHLTEPAFKLTMKAALFAVGCMPLFGAPLETAQHAPTTPIGIIQRRLAMSRMRGSAAARMRRKHLTELRAAARRSLATSLAFVSKHSTRSSRTPGITRPHTTAQASNLADDIHANSGRVHAVVMLQRILPPPRPRKDFDSSKEHSDKIKVRRG
jgi:hypothetical protein